MSERAGGTRIFWIAAAAALILDQLTKFAVYGRLSGSRDMVFIPGVFYLSPAQNTGVVWGLFGAWPQMVMVVGVLAAAVVVFYYHRYCDRRLIESLGWGLILGGAVGNLADRVSIGHVKDFINVVIAGWNWPTFNVADMFITVGAGLVIWSFLFARTGSQAQSSPKKA